MSALGIPEPAIAQDDFFQLILEFLGPELPRPAARREVFEQISWKR